MLRQKWSVGLRLARRHLRQGGSGLDPGTAAVVRGERGVLFCSAGAAATKCTLFFAAPTPHVLALWRECLVISKSNCKYISDFELKFAFFYPELLEHQQCWPQV